MPPAYEVLLLNTAIPQIQAAQSGDTYVVPRDIAFSTVASFAAGAEATPSIVATGDTNTGIWFPAADTVAISTGGTSRLRLDSSGNLGLGVTPSAWTTFRVAQIGAGAAVWGHQTTVSEAYLSANMYYDGNSRYISSGAATNYSQSAGGHYWATAPSWNGTGSNIIPFSTAMTLDASGNLGVGITSPFTRLDSASARTTTLNSIASFNTMPASVTDTTAFALGVGGGINFRARLNSSGYSTLAAIWSYRESGITDDYKGSLILGTADNTTGYPNERARITSGGDFGIGTNTINRKFVVGGTAGTSIIAVQDNNSGYATTDGLQIQLASTGDGYLWNYENAPWIFGTNNTERARITSGGYFKASNDGTYLNSTASYHELVSNTSDEFLARFANSASSLPYGLIVRFSQASPNDATRLFLECNDNSGGSTLRAAIRSNGGIANYQANDVNLSDRREKTNFAPAKPYLDTICAIPVQTFNYIDQSEDDPGLTLGVVAQDVQAVAPELVMESNWGTKNDPKMRLSIYQTDLQYALMKCIQELKAQNDELRARVAQLEAK